MKIFKFLAMLVLLVFVASCSKETPAEMTAETNIEHFNKDSENHSNDSESEKNSGYITEVYVYDTLGVVHNNALDYVKSHLIHDLDSLEQIAFNPDGTINDEIVFNYYRPIVNQFLSTQNIVMDGLYVNDFSMVPSNYDEYKMIANSFSSIGVYDSCVYNGIQDLGCISAKYDEAIISGNMKLIVTGSIFKYSTIYWGDYTPIRKSKKEGVAAYNWLAVGIADGRGAINWAGRGLILGGGGVAGAALAGGICESVGALVIQELWNRY